MGVGDNGVVNIGAAIYVKWDSQKGIIGKSGSLLKEIGQLARQDMQRLLGSKNFLELWVLAQPGVYSEDAGVPQRLINYSDKMLSGIPDRAEDILTGKEQVISARRG